MKKREIQMKKMVRLIVGVIIVVTLLALGHAINNELYHKKEVEARIKTIPIFSFKTLKGRTFTKNSLENKTTVFVYFNSDCDYCKSEATKIKERISEFKNSQLIFVSFENKEEIAQFAKSYGLYTEKNVVFLEDRKGEFSKSFDVNSIPYIVVYDNNHKFLKKFKGITRIDDILKVLE